MVKVSIVIPTIGREYFRFAYNSALVQDYDSMEIVVCDYSSSNFVREVVEKRRDERVRYIKLSDPGRLEGYRKGIELSRGEYIKLLLDDDMLLPGAIKSMADVLDSEKDVKLVTSARVVVNGFNRPTSMFEKISNEDRILPGIKVGDLMLMDLCNYVGEPSTTLFRKNDLIEPFGRFCGRDALCNDDVATWLNLLSSGNLAYISKPLSCFRSHKDQVQAQKKNLAKGMIDWINHIMDGRKRGFLKKDLDFCIALINAVKIDYNLLFSKADEVDKKVLAKLIAECLEILKNSDSSLFPEESNHV